MYAKHSDKKVKRDVLYDERYEGDFNEVSALGVREQSLASVNSAQVRRYAGLGGEVI